MKAAPKPFHTRGFVSMLLAFTFLGLAVSGVIMYIAPPCSVAERIGWTVMALSKDQWASLHQVAALIILVLAIIHLFVFNWKSFMCYLRDHRSKRQVECEKENNKSGGSHFRIPRELVAALLVAGVIYAGALTFIAPFGWLHDGSETIREHYRQEVPPGSGRGLGTGERDGQGSGAGSDSDLIQSRGQGQGAGYGSGRRDGSGQGRRRSSAPASMATDTTGMDTRGVDTNGMDTIVFR